MRPAAFHCPCLHFMLCNCHIAQDFSMIMQLLEGDAYMWELVNNPDTALTFLARKVAADAQS